MTYNKIVQISFFSSYFLCVDDSCDVLDFNFVTNGGISGV